MLARSTASKILASSSTIAFGLTLGYGAMHEAANEAGEHMQSVIAEQYIHTPVEEIDNEMQVKLLAISMLGGLSVGAGFGIAQSIAGNERASTAKR